MAEKQRMTGEEVVRWLMADDGADPVRESLKWMAQELMEAEVSDLVGAERGERTEDRATHRNGYRPRRWDTRAGELELAIPKLRRGSYFPSFLQPRKRSEQALVAVVQEAYVAGVSTRKVDQVVESLGLRVSKSEVSRICGGLDEQAGAEADERCRVKARVVERQLERHLPAQVKAQRVHRPLVGESLAVGEQEDLREQARRNRGTSTVGAVAVGEVLVAHDPLAVLGEQRVHRVLWEDARADACVEEPLLRSIRRSQHPLDLPEVAPFQGES